ncbi:MAG: cobalamin B12-binding domain-containing protein [Deltaproteobacteria bacterium]|nr:cobalamin B12-binding domain-containing protein [Deltaproteobacteria bacterium]
MIIKPYGDRENDGAVQMSFTLPVKASPEAREAAVQLVQKMGFERALVATMEAIDPNFTFFVVYGSTTHTIDFSSIVVPKLENPLMNFDEVNEFIKTKIGRKLVFVGGCIGYDAHTVGIDAIFNPKGVAHDWGFERYPWLSAHNLRAQVSCEEFVKKVVDLKADAVLVSRIVTQGDEHVGEFKKLIDKLKETPEAQPHLMKICGGPRVTHREALSWGYDAGFGPGTKPSEVASFIVHQLVKRNVR